MRPFANPCSRRPQRSISKPERNIRSASNTKRPEAVGVCNCFGGATLADAVEAAKESDVAIVCIGLNARLEGEESRIQIPGFSGGDRTNIDLPDSQEKLLTSMLATGKPTIVVLVNGSALAAKTAKDGAKDGAKAILEAWYPRQEGGKAIADTLVGDNNPAGRLPVTFYQSSDQLPAFDNYSMKDRTYRFFKGQPLYPFGFGLSYSKFSYSNLTIKPDAYASKYEVTAIVTNRSKEDGDEVVQCYLLGSANENPALRGFDRIHLRHGEKRLVRFRVDQTDARDKASLSVGGGQPLPAWPADHYVQAPLPR
jgi:beta-glucosidase